MLQKRATKQILNILMKYKSSQNYISQKIKPLYIIVNVATISMETKTITQTSSTQIVQERIDNNDNLIDIQ